MTESFGITFRTFIATQGEYPLMSHVIYLKGVVRVV